MKIAFAADHAGFRYKTLLIEESVRLGHEVTDMGTDSAEPVDYPLVIRPLAEAVARGDFERGVILGGSGNGEAMVANRVQGIRCSLCWSEESARLARSHNDANVLSLGERLVAPEDAVAILRIWLKTPFDGGRHSIRIDQIDSG